jgi:uncharacterized protein (TIGR02246 family)
VKVKVEPSGRGPREKWVAAYNAGDAAALAGLFTPDGVFIPPSGVVLKGREAIKNALAGRMKVGWTKETINVTDAGAAGNAARAIGDYALIDQAKTKVNNLAENSARLSFMTAMDGISRCWSRTGRRPNNETEIVPLIENPACACLSLSCAGGSTAAPATMINATIKPAKKSTPAKLWIKATFSKIIFTFVSRSQPCVLGCIEPRQDIRPTDAPATSFGHSTIGGASS